MEGGVSSQGGVTEWMRRRGFSFKVLLSEHSSDRRMLLVGGIGRGVEVGSITVRNIGR